MKLGSHRPRSLTNMCFYQFLILAILYWKLYGLIPISVALVFISLKTKDFPHFFKCFSAIQDWVLFFLVFSYLSSLDILECKVTNLSYWLCPLPYISFSVS
ncbi:hypothetical protein T4D_15508 [Trichinella pseudospiralis]|uniref:Uncharacterized protein n=1 Tax=Trichinella pseudospiralis TaxID=6337 RepID=A0A0V1EP95_TRIPS|nr:hypothetical protein T4D_15508 [Trichinella pseudospiralis]